MFTRRLMVVMAAIMWTQATHAQEDETISDSWSNELWREKLLTTPANQKRVGKINLGGALSQLDGDRAYEILGPCWKDLKTRDKREILGHVRRRSKHTGGLNDSVFDIIHLGMMDPERSVQDAAVAYLKNDAYREFSGPTAEYFEWRASIRGMDAEEVSYSACIEHYESLRATKPEDIPSVLKEIGRDYRALTQYDEVRTIVLELFDTWVADGHLDRANNELLNLRFYQHLYEPLAPGDTRDQLQVWRDRLPELWPDIVADQYSREFDLIVRALAEAGDMRSIPLFIALVEADNSFKTISGVGRGGLMQLTGVRYNPYHDGAWWRRWWESGETNLDKDILKIPIPRFTKTKAGKTHVPFPNDIDTVEGKRRWIVELYEAGSYHDVHAVARQIGEHGDPESIPLLIGILDADNSAEMITLVGGYALEGLTGVKPDRYHDGAWWRRWWARNEMELSEEILNIPIPEFTKTANGKRHIPFPANLDTLDGNHDWLVRQFEAGEQSWVLNTIAIKIASYGSPTSIPLLIGIIDADNSPGMISYVGGRPLEELTGVKSYAYHDGAWWRKWWARNELNLDEEIASIPIPNFTKTEHGKTHTPYPDNLDMLEGMLPWMVEQFEAGDLDEAYHAILRLIGFRPEAYEAIPTLIAMIEADDSGRAIYDVGYTGLGRLTRVEYKESHDGPWWREWWDANKDTYPEEISKLTIPTLRRPPIPTRPDPADPQSEEANKQPGL